MACYVDLEICKHSGFPQSLQYGSAII